jgi:DNA-binding response OmpR family regulator
MDQYGAWAKIVIVEDDVSLAEIYKTRLELLGYICFVAHDGIEAITVIEKERPSLVLLDIMMPKVAGDQILRLMRSTDWGKDIKVLVISNLNEADAPAGLRTMGIEGYAVKANLSNDQVDQLVDNILKPANQKEDINLDSGTPPPAAVTPQQ